MEKNKPRFIASVYVQDIIAKPLAVTLINLKIHPNYITILAIILSVLSGVLYLLNHTVLGGFMFFLALILDSTDGRVARGLQKFSKFGAKLDSFGDKFRSILVLSCIVAAQNISIWYGVTICIFYCFLPFYRLFIHRGNSIDPLQVYWNNSRFKTWLSDRNLVGLYTGWERAIICCIVAPQTSEPIIIIIFAVLLEQILFVMGWIQNKREWK